MRTDTNGPRILLSVTRPLALSGKVWQGLNNWSRPELFVETFLQDPLVVPLKTSIVSSFITVARRDVPVGVPLDLSTPVEWHELPKYNEIQVSQLIYTVASGHQLMVIL